MLISNKTKVFEFLYQRGNDSFNINQISRLIGISVGSAFKILKEFEKLRYVNVKKKNNALFYQIKLNNKTKGIYDKTEEERNSKERKKTKVICTIGHASDNPAKIKSLMEKGMDAARIYTNGYSDKSILQIIKNIRGVSSDIPILLDIPKTDKFWIRFALKNDVDFVCVPFIRSAEDIRNINKLLGYSDMKHVIGGKIKVIVKIGKDALRTYKEMVQEAYGIMIERDKLASDMKYEIVPKLQKMIVSECNKQGKPVIIYTQMLESMIKNKYPTKAEVSDIANAVLDGASCLMLSNETISGKYPLDSVEAMARIIKSTEAGQKQDNSEDFAQADFTNSIGKALLEIDKILSIDAVLIITSGGYSARMIASRRLRSKIIAATSSKKIFRQLNILWGIWPLLVNCSLEDISNNEKKEVILKALKKGYIKKRDQIAIIASVFHSKSKRTNLLEIHRVNEFLDYLSKNGE